MGIDRVRGLTDAELVTELATAKRHLYDLRFQLATRQLTDYHQIPETRHEIARILTVMTERDLDPTLAARPPRTGATSRRAAKPASRSTAERGGDAAKPARTSRIRRATTPEAAPAEADA